jgi:hypothetical protein
LNFSDFFKKIILEKNPKLDYNNINFL